MPPLTKDQRKEFTNFCRENKGDCDVDRFSMRWPIEDVLQAYNNAIDLGSVPRGEHMFRPGDSVQVAAWRRAGRFVPSKGIAQSRRLYRALAESRRPLD